MRPSNSMPTTAPLLAPNWGAALEGCRSPPKAMPKIKAHATNATLDPTDHEERFRMHPPIYCAILRRMCNTPGNSCPDVCPGGDGVSVACRRNSNAGKQRQRLKTHRRGAEDADRERRNP